MRPGAQAIHYHFRLHVNQQGGIQRALQLAQLGVESHRLGRGAGETVQNEAIGGIGLGKALGHQANNHVIGHQIAGIHILLSLKAQLCAFLYRSAQHVASRNVGKPVLLDEFGRLRALASARSAQQHNVHWQFLSGSI